MLRLCLLSLAVALGATSLAMRPAVAEDAGKSVVKVFASGEAGRAGYRIPAVIVAPNGDLLAFAEGRNKGLGDAGDIDLVMKRSRDGGLTWSEMQTLWDDEANTCGNPCPVVDESTGELHLLLTHNLGADREEQIKKKMGKGTRSVWVMTSRDSGATWTKPREITADVKPAEWGWYATGPGVGIQISEGKHAGRLVIPCDHTYDLPDSPNNATAMGSHIIYSDDHGKTWKLGGLVRPQANECQVVELTGGKLLLDMRSYSGRKRRFQSTSEDGGETWTEAKDAAELVEPICQASLIRAVVPNADAPFPLIFSNPADEKQRINLTLRVSLDDAKSWPYAYTLHAGPAAYSCLVKLDGGVIGCLYEAGEKNAYEAIVFARTPMKTLVEAKAHPAK